MPGRGCHDKPSCGCPQLHICSHPLDVTSFLDGDRSLGVGALWPAPGQLRSTENPLGRLSVSPFRAPSPFVSFRHTPAATGRPALATPLPGRALEHVDAFSIRGRSLVDLAVSATGRCAAGTKPAWPPPGDQNRPPDPLDPCLPLRRFEARTDPPRYPSRGGSSAFATRYCERHRQTSTGTPVTASTIRPVALTRFAISCRSQRADYLPESIRLYLLLPCTMTALASASDRNGDRLHVRTLYWQLNLRVGCI